jgi:hypothetical protein
MFVNKAAQKYKVIKQGFSDYWIKHDCCFNKMGIELSAFVKDEMNRPTAYKTAIKNKIIICYKIQICNAIAKRVLLLGHPVNCQVFNFHFTCSNDLKFLLLSFAKKNINRVDIL